jgi:hypothetical protein
MYFFIRCGKVKEIILEGFWQKKKKDILKFGCELPSICPEILKIR